MSLGSRYGTGSRSLRSVVQAPPLSPESGSGGPGILRGLGDTTSAPRLSLSPALSEVSDVTTGRVTLGLVNFTILVLLGFYWWTHSAQGGG